MVEAKSNDHHAGRTLLILGLLFLAAWLPRALALDEFVTPDERKWLARSANFYLALSEADFDATYQTEHPGVTVMWLGALGWRSKYPEYVTQTPGQIADVQLEEWLAENGRFSPLQLLVALRRWVVLAIALAVVAGFFPLRRLFGELAAALAVLYLAWDPFFVALSRQLHLDGLLASLICLALLTFLAWLYGGGQKRYLIASGVATGLALLTKTPAVFVLPTTGLLLLIEAFRRRRAGQNDLLALFGRYAVWLAIAGALFFLLWPVMWRNAPDVLRTIVEMMTVHGQGHELPNYFRGEVTYDPGLLFYPVAFFFRTTPMTLLGLLAALLWGWRQRWPLDSADRRFSAFGLALFALIFTLGMALGAKKFDRYLLPAFLVLDVVAALGWLGLTSWLGSRLRPNRDQQQAQGQDFARLGSAGVVLLIALFLAHGWLGIRHAPYYLTYYNPLAVAVVGDRDSVSDVMLVGWGDGLDVAAAWLNQQPDATTMRVASWYNDGPLSYFLTTDKRVLPYSDGDFWLADYAVAYSNQWQREIPSREATQYYESLEPVHTVTLNGLTMARIYDQRDVPPPSFTAISTDSAAALGPSFRLVAHQIPNPSVLPGDDAAVTLFLEKIAPVAADYELRLRLVGADGTELWQEVRPPAGVQTSAWPLDEIWQDPYEIAIPPTAERGRYALRLTMRDPATGEIVPIRAEKTDGVPAEVEEYELAQLTVQQPADVPVDAVWPDVEITRLRHPPRLTPGRPFIIEMTAAGATAGAFKVSLRLQDEAGTVVAQQDAELTEEMRFALTLPDDALPGDYALIAVVYDPVTLDPYADVTGEFSVPLSTIPVAAAGN